MTHIRVTVQEPDDNVVHELQDLSTDKKSLAGHGTINAAESLLLDSIVDKPREPIISQTPASRLSHLSVSLQPSPQLLHRRKFSIPAALPSGLLGIEAPGSGVSARRRFSNVSDAVTRKLSNTIGWRSQVPCQEIVTIGKSLCSQYIRSRLKRSGYLSRKCGLQRLRSAVSLPGGVVFREVYPKLLGLGIELERMNPKLYVNVTRQASTAPGGKLTSEKEVAEILTAISRELLKSEMTWGKVVAFYAVAGGLAVDCVRQGHYDYLTSIVEAMEEILEDELAQWIQDKGGWVALAALVKSPCTKWPSIKISVSFFSFMAITIFCLIVFLSRLFGTVTHF